MAQGYTKGTPIDTDPTLSLNSDIVVPSQKAVKSYVASQVGTPVTAVNATAPILSSGGTTPNLSIPLATNSVDGYLSAADRTAFNAKESALTFSSPLSRATNTISIPAATTSADGYLTSTDWNTFNGRVPSARTLTINGTGYDLSTDRSWTVTAASADLPEISVSTANAREDNYAPTGWPNSSNVVKVIRINSTNTDYMMSLGGLSSPTAGRIVTIYNSSTANNLIIIENLSTSSTAANRFRMANNMAYFLLPNRSVTFLYDGTYWTQFSASNAGGLDYFDDFTSLPSAVTAAAYSTFMNTVSSGTGAGVQSNSAGSIDAWGAANINTGSTATGSSNMSINVRRTGGNSTFGATAATYSMPYLSISKVQLNALGTGAQDYNAFTGISGTSSLSDLGMGYYWYYGGSAATFWTTRAQNTAGTLVSNTTSITASTNALWLGVYKPGGANIRDAVFFYSANGIVYSSVYKFVGTTGTYGGFPIVGLASTVGTTTKVLISDWVGASFNLAR